MRSFRSARLDSTRIRRFENEPLQREDIAQRIAAMALIPASGQPEDFTERVASDLVRWKKMIDDAGVQLD